MNASVTTIDQGRHWYCLYVRSSFEKRVIESLRERIHLENIENQFYEILLPSEEVLEMREGKKRKVSKTIFPGYILLNMEMNEAAWRLVRKVPHVLSFLGGSGGRPIPVSQKEIDKILQKLHENEHKPRPKVLFQPGQKIKIIKEPFLGFTGEVKKVDYDKKNRLQVSVVVFQRPILVELEFNQVQAI